VDGGLHGICGARTVGVLVGTQAALAWREDDLAPRSTGAQVCGPVGCNNRQCVGLRQSYWSNHVGN
jgi:hypothetical protein